MRLYGIGALTLGIVLAGTSELRAQVSVAGTIRVIVEDATIGRLSGAVVTASAPDTPGLREAVSDAEGVATLELLPPSARYVVKTSRSGYSALENADVLVSSGQTTTLRARLSLASGAQDLSVQGVATPLVDVTRATSGADITLQLADSLPTARTYQSFLQLVPGVLPETSGNPASRSSMNWHAAGSDNIGYSVENVYYFEAINVTDPVSGTSGSNLNTEIIQEQKVLTGGIPAEYVGTGGLVSTIITKSGSDRYTGSATYFFRNEGFVASNIHAAGATFDRKETAFTTGGPVVSHRLWGFGSFRYTNSGTDVYASDTLTFLRKSKTIQKQGFAKATWTTKANTIGLVFLNDPSTGTSSTNGSVANSRISRAEQGGNNYSATYNRSWGKALIDLAVNSHDTQLSTYAANTASRNNVSFQAADTRTLADEQLGGAGVNFPETRPTFQVRVAAQRQMANHTLKAGFEWARRRDRRDNQFTGPDLAQYVSISNRYQATGVTAGALASGAWSSRPFRTSTASDFGNLIRAINASANRAQFYGVFDTNGDGTISVAELNAAMVFQSTAGNPNGQINYFRSLQVAPGPQDTELRGAQFFAQDDFRFKRWSFNIGVRGEQWSHYATTGDRVFRFGWAVAPRLSAVLDVLGNGTHKASFYWGRYYSPIRMDITNFAGTATGQSVASQLYVGQGINQWVTYTVSGGPTTIEGFFSPTTKTPYTDELQLQYEADLGHSTSLSAAYYNRRTRDIFEDFDPSLYEDPSAYSGGSGLVGDTTAPNSLFLGWPYFGFTAANHPEANFFLGTLPGGKRDYNGLELVIRRRFAKKVQGLASYSYVNSIGNAISVGNAGFAGDVLWLDPRAPNMLGVVPGTIHNLIKVGGSYEIGWGLEVGGGYRWNSGAVANKTQSVGGHRVPTQVATAYLYGGVLENWVAPDAVGSVQNPAWGQLDLRLKLSRHLHGRTVGEAFVDVFNVTNNQGATRLQDLVSGAGTIKFLNEFAWNNPRNAIVGFRVRF